MYVDEQKQNAVYFAYYLENSVREKFPAFKFKGLDPDKKYKVVEINKDGKTHFTGENKTYNGSYLMEVGVNLNFNDEYDSAVLKLTAL
nr:GH36 C-terminal domain-containing protein [Pedobacter segetis]